MPKLSRLILPVFVVVIAAISISFLKHRVPLAVDHLYTIGKFESLNNLTGSKNPLLLPFYQGRINDVLTGPLTSLIAGVVFLWLALTYLREVSLVFFALAVFIFLVLTRLEVLTFPPYCDTLVGPFSDAIWLLRHHFDYLSYLHQDNFINGGPQVYPNSIYPSFLALLMKLLPNPAMFLITIHLIVFVLASFTVSLLRSILLNKFDSVTSALAAVCVLSFPLFQSMSELINMEMPCLFFVMLSVYYLIQKRFLPAGIASVVALLIKAPGGIASLSVFVFSVFFLMTDAPRPAKIRNFLIGILCLSLTVLNAKIISLINLVPYNHLKFLEGWLLLKPKKYTTGFMIISLFFVIYFGARWKIREGLKKNLEWLLSDHILASIIFLMTALWFFIYANFTSLLARYELLLLPFYFCAVLILLESAVKNKRILHAFLSMFVIFSCWNAYGAFYEQNVYQPSGNLYERSLEYRNDLKMQMKLAEELEQHYKDYLIGAPPIIVQTLNYREVGYVKTPLDVMIYGARSPQESIKNFYGFNSIDLTKTIWVALQIDLAGQDKNYPLSSRDKIVKTIEVGDKKAFLFQGGFGIEQKRVLIELKMRGLI